jgi:prepilin-type N-terminal cleavage/methylation domain-containing protein/prepilin-type processing-associated H-X9-DG protein
MKRGFTLIELLVVIAIIAILAAILFPVFAQARQSAQKTSCLSNLKQIDIGVQMYVQDYEEQYPSCWSGGMVGEAIYYIQPYLKSYSVLFCPSRHVPTSAACGNQDNPNCESQLYGYGWNTGSAFPAGFTDTSTDPPTSGKVAATDGLFSKWDYVKTTWYWTNPDTTVQYTGTVNLAYGRALGSVVTPATTLMFGDTGDTPRMSFSHKRLSACAAPGNKDSLPRHGAGNNVCYCDGHAKWQRYVQDLYTNDYSYYMSLPTSSDSCKEEKTFADPCQYSSYYDGSNGNLAVTGHCAGL